MTGRPVAFAFAAAPPAPAGSEMFLRAGLLRQSLNYRSLDRGQSYPLFYETLFADLRAVLAKAATTARPSEARVWRGDRSRGGLVVRSQTDLEDVLDVNANTIRLRPRPEELVFVSAKSAGTAVAPWLAV